MIGMDNDPATFGRPPFSTANIYLNSFMCVELEAGAKLYRQFGKEERYFNLIASFCIITRCTKLVYRICRK